MRQSSSRLSCKRPLEGGEESPSPPKDDSSTLITSTLFSSTLEALNSCFHFMFFGALDEHEDHKYKCTGYAYGGIQSPEAFATEEERLRFELEMLERAKMLFFNNGNGNDAHLYSGDIASTNKHDKKHVICHKMNPRQPQPHHDSFKNEGSMGFRPLVPMTTTTTPIIHSRQLYSWDCGLACIQMILRWVKMTRIQKQRTRHQQRESGAYPTIDTNSEVCQRNLLNMDMEMDMDMETSVKGIDSNDTIYGGSAPLSQEEIVQKHWLMKEVRTKSIWTIDLFTLLDKLFGEDNHNNNDDDESDMYRLFHQYIYGHEGDVKEKNEPPREYTNGNDENDSSCTHEHVNSSLFSISYMFCSENLGVDETYRSINYYKSAFRRDERRVKQLFDAAHKKDLNMINIHNLDLDFILTMISRPNIVAMVLIDSNVLTKGIVSSAYKRNGSNTSMPELDSVTAGADASANGHCTNFEEYLEEEYYGPQAKEKAETKSNSLSFSGHYVILVGISRNPKDIARANGLYSYAEQKAENIENVTAAANGDEASNAETDASRDFCLIIKDPGSHKATEFLMPELFDQARIADGTDRDIIFIAQWPALPM